MDRQDDFYRRIQDREKEERKQARREKWARREKSFWRAFLFTEDGKPKSALVIYTFFLSFVFLGFYVAGFWLAIEQLTEPLAPLPAALGNLIQSLLVGAAGAALSAVLHCLLPDKRLAFGTHLWLVFYAVAATVTMAVMLHEWESIRMMLVFVGWFVFIPVLMGLTVTWLLFRRDHTTPRETEEEPEWKKYIHRR